MNLIKQTLASIASTLYAFVMLFMHRQGFLLTAMPMRSTDFRGVVEPILNDAFDGIYDQRADEWKKIFKEEQGIQRAWQEDITLYGFTAAPEMPEGMPVTYQQGGILFTTRYVFRVYGLAFALTRVLIEDGDHVRIGTTFSKHLAQSLIETKETRTANVLNRAFNSAYVGGDGQALIGNAHPTIGAAYSNVLTTPAALSQTSLEQMLIQIRQATDDTGKSMRLMPKRLIIGPQNIMQAEVLLKSVLRAGTSNNDINPVKSLGLLEADPVVISRLTSPTAWFIQTDAQNGLKLLMRRKNHRFPMNRKIRAGRKMEKSMEGDFETDSMRYKATERYDVGFSNARTLYGTPGI